MISLLTSDDYRGLVRADGTPARRRSLVCQLRRRRAGVPPGLCSSVSEAIVYGLGRCRGDCDHAALRRSPGFPQPVSHPVPSWGRIWATTLRSPASMSELRVASHPSLSIASEGHRLISELVHDTRRVSTIAAPRQFGPRRWTLEASLLRRRSQNPHPPSSCRQADSGQQENPHTIRPEPDVQSRKVCGCRGAASTCSAVALTLGGITPASPVIGAPGSRRTMPAAASTRRVGGHGRSM